jgi:two-component system, OmpR family, KDP operon response regulator KdpE
MKSPRALLLYEEEDTRKLLRTVILGEGWKVEEVPFDSPTAAAPIEGYQLVLFEILQPTRRLLEALRAWHDGVPGTELVVVGSRITQAHRMAVLKAGVSSYLKKTTVGPELANRVRTVLRRFRSHNTRSRQFPFGTGMVDLETRCVRAADGQVRLTPTECGILEHLALHMNQTVPFRELVEILWGADPKKGVYSLRVFIRKLRKKLEPDPTHPIYLVTEPMIGYRLQAPSEVLGKSADPLMR